jgi:hypothetical protein
MKDRDGKIRSTKVDAGNLEHKLLNRLWSILAVNVKNGHTCARNREDVFSIVTGLRAKPWVSNHSNDTGPRLLLLGSSRATGEK